MNSKIIALAAFLALSLFSENGRAHDDVITLTDPLQAHMLFEKALNERNLEQLCALYSDDCVMVSRDGKTIEGRDAARKLFQSWINGVIRFDIETVYRVRSGDIILFRSSYHSVYRDAEGKEREYVGSGVEVVQRQKDGTWRIVIDHHAGGAAIPMSPCDRPSGQREKEGFRASMRGALPPCRIGLSGPCAPRARG